MFTEKRMKEIKQACKDADACQGQYKKLLRAKDSVEFANVLFDNISFCKGNNILTDEEYFLSNIGNNNTGHSNTGDLNTGDKNTGDSNTGNKNAGDRNAGDSNTGDWNTGDWNTGDWNAGYRNTGSSNTGYRNTGDGNTGNGNTGDGNAGHLNTGDWNSCNRETGYFNTKGSETIRVFNKDCDKKIWDKARKPEFLYRIYLTEWVYKSDMTNEEKEQYPTYKAAGGYLKSYNYKEAWKKAFDNASEEDIKLLKALPNFDADVFLEITGIDLTESKKAIELKNKIAELQKQLKELETE